MEGEVSRHVGDLDGVFKIVMELFNGTPEFLTLFGMSGLLEVFFNLLPLIVVGLSVCILDLSLPRSVHIVDGVGNVVNLIFEVVKHSIVD